MLGIIIWAILIIFIVICVCPGFITAFIVCSAIVLCGYCLMCWIIGGCKLPSKSRRNDEKTYIDAIAKQERENAIDEWERKWRRKHPCRKQLLNILLAEYPVAERTKSRSQLNPSIACKYLTYIEHPNMFEVVNL